MRTSARGRGHRQAGRRFRFSNGIRVSIVVVIVSGGKDPGSAGNHYSTELGKTRVLGTNQRFAWWANSGKRAPEVKGVNVEGQSVGEPQGIPRTWWQE
jgi:hypothetical protein